MTHEKSTDGLGAMAAAEMAKAFRYYNYMREFYGYLCDSLDLVFEDDCNEFDPAYASAEKEFPPTDGIDENSTARALALDKMARAIRAYETMQTIVAVLDEKSVENAAKNRGMMQDSHKFALTSIAEWFPMPSIWREFDESAQKWLDKYSGDAQSAVSLMEPLSLESTIHKIFAEQKECLEKFLPQKIEELKKLQTEMDSSYKGKADWSSQLRRGELTILAARSGVGMKTFALNVAENVALDDGKGVVYFDLNNSDARRSEELLCQRANVDYCKIDEDTLDKTEMKMLMTAVGEIIHSHLRIEDATDMSLTELARKARLYKQLKSLDVLIIDYLQLLKVQSNTNRDESLKRAAWTLKNLAVELHISILLLYPLGRETSAEQERPQLSDFIEIPGVTQEADAVWILDRAFTRTHREKDREKAELSIVKSGDNSEKNIPLRFTRKKGFALAEA